MRLEVTNRGFRRTLVELKHEEVRRAFERFATVSDEPLWG